MSIRKMTFSLASLILIMAFGLVFAPTAVMAHDTDDTAPGDQHGTGNTVPTGHVHATAPTVESIELVDIMVGTASTVSTDGMKVVLVDDADGATPALADGAGVGQFLVKITFSGDVYDGDAAAGTIPTAGSPGTTATAAAADDLLAAELTVNAAEEDSAVELFGAGSITIEALQHQVDGQTIPTIATAIDADSADLSVFYVTFQVAAVLFGGEDTDSADLPINIWISVNEDAVFTRTGLVDGRTVYGEGNDAGAGVDDMDMPITRQMFTIVSEIDNLPTVEVEAAEGASLTAPFEVTLTFSSAVDMLTTGDLVVTGALVGAPAKDDTTDDGTVWKVMVSHDGSDATEITIAVKDTVATADDMMGMATVPDPADGMTGTGTTLAAEAYLVIRGADADFDATTLPGVTNHMEWPNFPEDLAAFFIAGGTVDVTATGGDVIISEFMVARDSHKIGTGDPADGQWIELRNKHATEEATNVMVTFSDTQPASVNPPAGVVDRLSNVVLGKGWNFTGAFGNEVITGSSKPEALVNFISIRRKADKEGADGWTAAHWERTPTSLVFAPNRVGTPGKVNAPTIFTPVTNRTPAKNVIISEVANRKGATGDANEWIELKGPAGKSLKNWKLSIITKTDFDAATDKAGREAAEKNIFTFPNNDSIKISPNGYLLLTDQDPEKNELAADYANGVVTPTRYKNAVVELGALPDDGNFVLILRSNKDKKDHNNIEDIAGYADLSVDDPYTTLWPLTGNVGHRSDHNKLEGGEVHARVRESIDGYSATAHDKLNESAFATAGWTGIGYDRKVDATNAENGGTPGYPRGALKSYETADGRTDPANPVIISEIMYATGHRANTPQWIELYNTSKTDGINLDGWRVTILNHDQDVGDDVTFSGDLEKMYDLSGRIPPGQTFLLVAYPGRDNSSLPPERVHRLRPNRGELILSQYGFEITLESKAKEDKEANRKAADTAGNLGTVAEGAARVRSNARSYVDPAWELPMGVNDDGARISIVRGWANGTVVNGQTVRSSDLNDLLPGTTESAWTQFDMSGQLTRTVDETSYGHPTDISSPGHTIGGQLPVSLSKFRPERMKDTGQIVIRWITESELNNAGFNILRSEKRDGEFTKINTKLIAGQGTTTERTAYEYADTSAKPNVVYYYQIQDVSFDGQVTTLRTTHLRGNVTAVGKATTTWGDIKALQ